jgi:hypothetical protein
MWCGNKNHPFSTPYLVEKTTQRFFMKILRRSNPTSYGVSPLSGKAFEGFSEAKRLTYRQGFGVTLQNHLELQVID